MELERFTCCQENPHFEKIKNGYRCADCGKIFLYKSIDYNGENITFHKMKYRGKYRGDWSHYLKETGVFSTLQSGMVSIMQMDDKHTVLDKKDIKVKKAVMRHSLNFNNTFLTVTQSGIIDVYDVDTQEAAARFKPVTRKDSSFRNFGINVCPLGTDGRWLLVDMEKVSCCSNDFKECRTLLLFKDTIKEKILSVQGVDHNPEYNCFAVHIEHFTEEINNTQYIRRAIFMITCNKEGFDVRYIDCAPYAYLAYDSEKRIFRGTNYDKMIMIDEQGTMAEQCRLPTVRRYSDGGGIFWVEEFIRYPEKLFFLTDDVAALVYLEEIIILDLQRQKIIAAYETGHNLINAFYVMDPNTVCFTAGINTYIVDIDYDTGSQ